MDDEPGISSGPMSTRTARIGLACALSLGALLLAAPAGQAAVTIGSNLNGNTDDNLSSYCPSSMTCTITNLSLPPASTASGVLTSPINGVVVSWSVKSNQGPEPSLALRVLRPAGGANYTGIGTSASIAPAAGINTANTQLPIRQGDSVGLNNSQSKLVVANTPGADALAWGSVNGFPNGLANGATGTGAAQPNKEVLVRAVVEPDADADGLGDETQDPCPTFPGTVCPSGMPGSDDTVPPQLRNLRVKPRTFRAIRRAKSAQRRRRLQRGTLIRFSLTEPSVVMFALDRRLKRKRGRRRGRVRYKRVGSFTRAGTTGRNAHPFSGRFKGKLLKSGAYRIRATALDGAQNRSQARVAKFKVVK